MEPQQNILVFKGEIGSNPQIMILYKKYTFKTKEINYLFVSFLILSMSVL